jgi:hypothetical protein
LDGAFFFLLLGWLIVSFAFASPFVTDSPGAIYELLQMNAFIRTPIRRIQFPRQYSRNAKVLIYSSCS